jgi:hypothetical protein
MQLGDKVTVRALEHFSFEFVESFPDALEMGKQWSMVASSSAYAR